MPLFEYQCQSCGVRVEVIQRADAEGPQVCTSCDGSMKKLLSAPAIQFKGSGFYKTDYASSSAAAPKGEGTKGESSQSEGSKSDTSKNESTKSTTSDSGSPESSSKPAASKSESKAPAE